MVLNVDEAARSAPWWRCRDAPRRHSVLVTNAGITRDPLAMRMRDDDWDAVIDTNLKRYFA